MTHPLTEEIIEKIAANIRHYDYSVPIIFKCDMRAAADWQLEKCDDDLGNILHCLALAGKITEEERIQIFVLFKEAMRPTNATNWRPTK